MKRRGFLAVVLAVVATPALAQVPRRKRRWPYVKPDVSFPEYRRRNGRDYMRVRRTYWSRPIPGFGHYPQGWRPCLRRDFYWAHPRYGLQRNYKSPVRIWWEKYVERGRR